MSSHKSSSKKSSSSRTSKSSRSSQATVVVCSQASTIVAPKPMKPNATRAITSYKSNTPLSSTSGPRLSAVGGGVADSYYSHNEQYDHYQYDQYSQYSSTDDYYEQAPNSRFSMSTMASALEEVTPSYTKNGNSNHNNNRSKYTSYNSSSSTSSTCSCECYGITRQGNRVRLSCGGELCGSESSDCCSSDEEAVSPTSSNGTRRYGVHIRS